MNKYIPYNITCPLASCSRSNTCARYANYQKAKSEEASFMVLERGADLSLGFASYEEQDVLVEK